MARDEAYWEAEQRIQQAQQDDATELDLSNLGLTELPETIGQLVNLKILNLGYDYEKKGDRNQLTALPESLGNLSQLQRLFLHSNQFTTLPEWLGNLSQLQMLILVNNQLTILPECLGNLYQLQELFLSSNELTTLPEWLGSLSTLQELDLANNQISVLPACLGSLFNLKALYLNSNQLTTLPESLGNLSQLTTLGLSFNQITTLPESLSNLSQLTNLGLSDNQLTLLPDWLGKLTQLQMLGLTYSKLVQLPDWLSNLKNIQCLYLGYKEQVGRWGLEYRSINSNKLTSLPDWLSQLTQLNRLGLEGNLIIDLPPFLADLEYLKELNLEDNPLNPELAVADKQGIDAVKAYLRARSEGEVTLNEAKLILVGEGEVGKSCLLGALRGDAWVEGRPTTHGIEIKPVTVTETNGREITLNGWDFGGQRVYRPTHQLFFSAPAVYLVVWKPREGPQQGFVREWITLIKHREPDAKILVVATHGGPTQRQPDIDRQELLDCFGEDTVVDFFFIDSKPSETGECRGINDLKQKMTAVAAALPGMGRTIPAKWHQVREALRATGQAYMSYKDVMAICEAQGVTGFLAELCIRVYHTLGNWVHYHYDPLLKDIVILKPDWLAKAISFVLDDQKTRDNNGLVDFDHLSQIWSHPPFENESGYPKELHPIFLRLMERFDLSYKVVLDAQSKTESTTSLIAQLVQDNRPQQKLSQVWESDVPAGEQQQVQICRIVDERGQLATAEGLFYQLIVRLHKYSLGRNNYKDSVHWQRGLVLDDDYNGLALLEHINTNIRITVRAAYPEFFLHQLTREVKWLVENFWEGLRCEIVVPCIEPCGKNQPGLGQFELEKLIESKRKGRLEYPCNVSGCDEWQNIDQLMRNASTQSTSQIMVSEQLSDVQKQIKQVRRDIRVLDSRNQKRYQNLSQGQKVILSKVDQRFDILMRTFTDEAKEGPRLFSFKPVEPGFFDRPKWINEKFQLTLWCEHSRLPLPELNPNNKKAGVYELNLPREWFIGAAPYLKFMTTTIGLISPIAGSATKMILDDAAYNSISEELDLAQKSIDFATKGMNVNVSWLSKSNAPDIEYGEYVRAEGSMLREIHTFLKEKDPSFGGLVRVQNKRQEFLWVHPDFVSEY